jgi:hypothetical protein
MRQMLFALIGIFIGSNMAFANSFRLTNGCGFTAPNVDGDAYIGNPQIGDIVYDTSTSGFYGYSGGTWVLLGAVANPNHAPTMQTFTSGSGVYTTPSGVLYLHVTIVGGGGGGFGSGTASGTAAGSGGNTAFGTSLLLANGGSAPTFAAYGGASGGTASIGTGAQGIALTGAASQGSVVTAVSNTYLGGTNGASSPLGGAGNGGGAATAGGSAVANTGSGGGGAGIGNPSGTTWAGAGGGAGGYINATIASPGSSYSYSVGTGGTGGGAGTSGSVGGAGGSGIIIVEEYYQ